MTYYVTADYASQNFEEIIQRAKTDVEGVTIVKDNTSFVLIDQSELEALIETAELLQVPDISTDISQAREDYQQGETLTMEDIFGFSFAIKKSCDHGDFLAVNCDRRILRYI